MKRRVWLAGSVAAASTAWLPRSVRAESPKPSAVEVARAVQAFYDKAATYQASFRQRVRRPAKRTPEDRAGRVVLAKPGKMSWRFDRGDRIVSNGSMLLVYVKDEKTLYEMPLDRSPYPAALAFVLGDGHLQKHFRLGLLDNARLKAAGAWVLDCKPRAPTPAYQRLLLYVDQKKHHVRRAVVVDAQRGWNRFDFVGSKVNAPTPKGEFFFTPPGRTRIIRA